MGTDHGTAHGMHGFFQRGRPVRFGLFRDWRAIIPFASFPFPIRRFQMLTIAALIAGLLSASDPAAKSPATPLRVEAGHGVRVAVPPLGPAGAADQRPQQQVFAFYVGLFGR
jgi:hypothetical protein